MINSINASQRCQLTYHSFTYAYLCVCVIFGIYLYETNIPFIKYIDEALTYGLFFYYIAILPSFVVENLRPRHAVFLNGL